VSRLPKCLPALCSARPGLVSWLVLGGVHRLNLTYSNGTMVSTKAVALSRSIPNDPIGDCFAMVAPAERLRGRWLSELIGFASRSALSKATSCSFRVGTSCAYSPRVGWGLNRQEADSSS